jgi:hypothetical protein
MAEFNATQPYVHGLVAHDARLVLWPSETTATEAGLLPGRATQTTGAGTNLIPSGTPGSGDPIYVRTVRPGCPDSGAEMAWRANTSDEWIGWDPPTTVSYVEPIVWDAAIASQRYEKLSAAALPSGTVLLAYEDNTGATNRNLCLRLRSTAGAWSSELVLALEKKAVDIWFHPCVVLASTTVRVYGLLNDVLTSRAQLACWEASLDHDLTDAASWSLVSRECFATAINIGAAVVERMSVATTGGQWCMVYGLATDVVHQTASRDGYGFAAVTSWTGAANPTLLAVSGVFVVAWRKDLGAGVHSVVTGRSGTAFGSLVASGAVTVVGNLTNVDIVLGMTADDQGNTWLYQSTDANGVSCVYMSDDTGKSWLLRDDRGRTWCATSSASTNVVDLATVWWRDRVLAIHRVGAGTYDRSLLVAHLGGYSTVPLPQSTWGVGVYDRATFGKGWWPVGNDTYSATSTGSPTRTLDTDVSQLVSCGGGDTLTLSSGTLADQRAGIAAAALKLTAGTANLKALVTDGTNTAGVRVAVTSAGVTMFDAHSGTNLGSALITGKVEVLVAVTGTTGTAWYRAWAAGARTWTRIAQSAALTTSAGTDTEETLVFSASTTANLYALKMLSVVSSIAEQSAGRGLGAFSSPADLRGRPMSGARSYVTDGRSLAVVGGPTLVGDAWTVEPDHSYAVEQAAWSPAYPNPSTRWRSTGLADESIAWQPKSGEAEDRLSPMWAMVLDGAVQTVHVTFHDGTSWQTERTVNMYRSVTATRYGGTLLLDGATTSGAFVQEDELAGGFASDGTYARRIIGNTAGVFGNPAGTVKRTTIQLEGITGAESATSSTWRVVFPRQVVMLAPPIRIRGVRVRVGKTSGARLTPSGYHDIKVLAGPVYILGKPHGLDSTTVHAAGVRTYESEAGARWSARARATVRTRTVSWQNGVERMKQVRGYSASEPDWMAAWASTSAAANAGLPAYSRGEAESTLPALVSRWAANGTPVAHLPRIDRTSAEYSFGPQRCLGLLVGTPDPTFTVEDIGGAGPGGWEYVNDLARLGAIRLVELVG